MKYGLILLAFIITLVIIGVIIKIGIDYYIKLK